MLGALVGLHLAVIVVLNSSPPGVKANPLVEALTLDLISQNNAKSSTSLTLTLLTGTHLPASAMQLNEATQSPQCAELAFRLHLWWSPVNLTSYQKDKTHVEFLLSKLQTSCVLVGSRAHSQLWTFPFAWRPEDACSLDIQNELSSGLQNGGPQGEWLHERPNLVALAQLVKKTSSVKMQVGVRIGSDFKTMQTALESKCKRMAPYLARVSDLAFRLYSMQKQVGLFVYFSFKTKSITFFLYCLEDILLRVSNEPGYAIQPVYLTLCERIGIYFPIFDVFIGVV
jgi:hypothetical protein